MDLKLLPNNSMTFGDNQHGNAVLEKLKIQREMVRCCDVILHVDGQQFQAHRCVLSACSPFFDSLFKASKTVKEQLTISADNAEVFHTLLAYMYTGTVVIDKSNVSELLKLSNKLLLAKLKEYCAEYLQRYLDTINCLTVLEMANKFGLDSLQKIANNIIATNLSAVLSGEEILDVSLARMENFLRSPNWKISNDEILSLVTSWVYHCLDEREAHFRSLLTWVSWENLDSEKFLDVIVNHPLFVSSLKCRSFLCDSLDENAPHIRSKLHFVVDSNAKYSEPDNEEDGDKFLNLAISTAIGENLLNEPNIDKYLMETGKELLRTDFHFQDQKQIDFRDFTPTKNSHNIAYPQEYSQRNHGSLSLMEKSLLPDDFCSVPSSSNNQSFDISFDDLSRYSIDSSQKYKHFIIQRSCEEQTHYKNYSVECDAQNCDSLDYSVDRRPHYEAYNSLGHDLLSDDLNQRNSNQKLSYWLHKSTPDSLPPNIIEEGHSSQIFSGGFDNVSNDPSLDDQVILRPRVDDFSVNLPTSVYKKDKLTAVDSSYPINSEFNQTTLTVRLSDYEHNLNPSNSNSTFTFSSDANQESTYENRGDTDYKIDEGNSLITQTRSTDYARCKQQNPTQKSLGEEQNSMEIPVSETQIENSREENEFPTESKIKSSDSQFSGGILLKKRKSFESTSISTGKSEENSKDEIGIQSNSLRSKAKKLLPKKLSTINKKKGTTAVNSNLPTDVKTCDVCLTTFSQSKEYFRHMRNHFPGPQFKCDLCKSEFKRIYHLLDHRRIHLGVKPFECAQCSFSTNKKFNLVEHMKLHSVRLLSFKCDKCSASFSRKTHLQVHMTKHSSDRPFRCETCEWTGKTRSCLQLHKKIHSGDLFSCQYPDCAYQAAKKSHLKEHMQYHTKSRPFSCKFCAMTFISKSHLKRHIMKHETPNLRQCPHCSYSCTRADELKIHIKRRHSTTAPPAPVRQRKLCLKKRDSVHFSSSRVGLAKDYTSDEDEFVHTRSHRKQLEGQSARRNPLYPHSFDPSMASNLSTTADELRLNHPENENSLLEIVSDITSNASKDHSTSFAQGTSYLDPSIGQAFPGLLDVSYGSSRFTPPPPTDDDQGLYYAGV